MLLKSYKKSSLNILSLFLIASTFIFFSGTTFANDNLLKNGNFEKPFIKQSQILSFWSFQKYFGSASLIRTEDAKCGKVAAKIVLSSTNYEKTSSAGINSQVIKVVKGLYVLKGWYKTIGKTEASLKYTIHNLKGDTKSYSKKLSSVNSWTEFSFTFNVWDKTVIDTFVIDNVSVELLALGKGDVFYDDISFSKRNDPVYLRMFPAEFKKDNMLPFISETPNYLRIMLGGFKDKVTGPVEILLDMPEGTSDYDILGGGEKIVINNEKLVRFKIKVPESEIKILKDGIGHSSVTCWFSAPKVKENLKAYFTAVVDGKEYTRKEVNIKLLPPLPEGPRPKRFRREVSWAFWGNSYKGTKATVFFTEDLYPEMYNLITSMGINTFLTYYPKEKQSWRKYVLQRFLDEGKEIWLNIPKTKGFYHKYLEHKGWETDAILGGMEYLDELCGDYYRKAKPYVNSAHFDFEPPNAEDAPLWDNMPTRKMFAEKYGYDLSKLTVERLQGELRGNWLTFRTWQIGEALRLWAKYVHSIHPDWEITVSQGSGRTNKHIRYAVYNDIPNIVHMPQIYIKNPKQFARIVIAMQDRVPSGKFFPMFTSTMVADMGWLAIVSPQDIYSHNISLAMLGCLGAAQWPDIRRGYGMEYIWEISRAMRDIAYLEDYVYDGKVLNDVSFEVQNSEIDWEEHSLFRAYELRGKILIAFSNMYQVNEAEVKVKLNGMSGNNWKIFNPINGKEISVSNKNILENVIVYNVPANTLGMLVIEKQ